MTYGRENMLTKPRWQKILTNNQDQREENIIGWSIEHPALPRPTLRINLCGDQVQCCVTWESPSNQHSLLYTFKVRSVLPLLCHTSWFWTRINLSSWKLV